MCAPVKAPFVWPNSSLSWRFSGIAPQLIVTSGLSRRDEWLCSALATTSLPVPLSPVISTVESSRATCSTIFNTSVMAGDAATMPSNGF